MMRAGEWWTAARGPGRSWRTLDAWMDLTPADKRRIRARAKEGLHHPDPAVRARAQRVAEAVELAGWQPSGPALSPHVALELAAAVRRGRALDPGERVGGCGCPRCTNIPLPPARTATLPLRDYDRDPLPVDAARARPLLEVVERLGLGPTRKVGREYLVCCPLHADADPSLRLDAAKGLWYCDPCGEGGDGIRLVMAVRGVSFPDAVRALVS